jgi:iron complex outermembrane receptor protein
MNYIRGGNQVSLKIKTVTSIIAPFLIIFTASPGHAQNDAALTQNEPSESSQTLDVITVTAQKRSQNSQHVPITISTLDAASATAFSVQGTTDLQLATTGLYMHQQANALLPTLNGISTLSANPGDESAIAVYVDGVYIAAPTSAIMSLNDIEQLEIEKGPQGTLFGRNAVAGVIQVITKTPEQTPELDLSLGYGNYNRAEGSLYGTTGVTDEIATNVAIHWDDQSTGWGKNVYTGAEVYKSHEFTANNKWLLTPNENTRIVFAWDYENDTNPIGSVKTPLPGTYVSIPPGGTHIGGFYDVRENVPATAQTPQWGTSLHVTQNLNWARLVSISAYRGGSALMVLDLDGIQSDFLALDAKYDSSEVTQEFQLKSPDSSKVKWIGGLYYMDFLTNSFFHQYGTNYGSTEYVNTLSHLSTESYAAYGDVTVPITRDTSVSGGLRYTIDQAAVNGTETNVLGPIAHPIGSATFQKPTWRLAIDHQFTPELMTYVSYNRGFQSGLYNSNPPTNPVVKPSVIDAYEAGMKSQWLDNHLRTNASVFYYDYSNVQLTAFANGLSHLLNAASSRIHGVNLAVDAIPVNALRISAGMSYVNAIYSSFPDAPVTTPLPAGGYLLGVGNSSGNEMIYSPKWTFNARAQYSIPTKQGTYGFSAIYYYNGSYYPDTGNRFPQPAYHLVNASVNWTSPNERWTVRLWGKNLTDSHYYNTVTINNFEAAGSPAAPLMYGVTVSTKVGGT